MQRKIRGPIEWHPLSYFCQRDRQFKTQTDWTFGAFCRIKVTTDVRREDCTISSSHLRGACLSSIGRRDFVSYLSCVSITTEPIRINDDGNDRQSPFRADV